MPLPDGFTIGLYFDDPGNTWYVKIPYFYVLSGLHREWDSYDWTNRPNLPPGLIMRHLNLRSNTDGTRRAFPVNRIELGYWPFIGSTCTLPRQNGTVDTYTVVSYNAERYQPNKYRLKRR